MPESPAVDPEVPSTLRAVLWLPLSLYARHPIALLAATALPLLPGQALGAYYNIRETEGARVVDGEVLAPPTRPGFDDSLTLGVLTLEPGWPGGALTFVGWVLGLAAGSLVAAALLLGLRLPARAVVKAVLRRLPLLLTWAVVVLAYVPVSLITGGMGFAALVSHLQGFSSGIAGGVFWLPIGVALLVALTPLLIGMPVALLRGLTLVEGIGAAWLLCRRRRIAHVLCLFPLAALLLLPQEIGERMAETAAGTVPALGTALGLKILLVLFLAPLPVLLLTAQSLWTRPGPVPIAGLSDGEWIADQLDERGATAEAPHRRPIAAAALFAVLVAVPLVGGGVLGANPHGAPVVTTERLDRGEFHQLTGDAAPAEYGEHAPVEVTRSDGRPLVADRDRDVHLRDCRNTECSEWDTVSLGGGTITVLHTPPGLAVDDRDRPRMAFLAGDSAMLTFLACADPGCSSWESVELLHLSDVRSTPTPENHWDSAPVLVLSLDGDRPVLLVGHTRVTCLDPMCGLTGGPGQE
ncbi:hypothetical protein [Nocardiopsis ganjiahuensis]|uniref:hypothetical protein n=1 Tax=Nocardiopsis ganjiahuensis TaxID=239984 RepID=UPI0003471C92|nr:hypothetical protein [Nocardiopsis ganjiahuensis]